MATATQVQTQAPARPTFIDQILQDYRAKVSHTFILYGNINDFPDNAGTRKSILVSMEKEFDDNLRRECEEDTGEKSNRATIKPAPGQKRPRALQRIFASYNLSTGLEFRHPDSKQQWIDAMTAFYGKDIDNWPANWASPTDPIEAFSRLNQWFKAAKKMAGDNLSKMRNGMTPSQELLFTIAFTDADTLFPDGPVANLSMDRTPIVHIRNWARDEDLGESNRILLMTRHLTEIHESIRGGASGVVTISIPKPTIQDREQWLNNFSHNFENSVKNAGPRMFNGIPTSKINLADGFDFRQFAVQSAGMSRRQMEDVIMKSWNTGVPVDFTLIRERKQRALEDEYQGIIDFVEPENGFEHIGGHEHLKRYFERKIIQPLRTGDRRRCSAGLLMTGPPGTGKTMLALALAKEAKMNFMLAHLDKLFGGLVGDTETKTRKFLEAVESAAPVIVFMDEMDSVLSSGRSSKGDSGTSARMFNSIMQFLSDQGRRGRVVIIGASNRPDLLDVALIRSGRFDAKIPALPPAKGDWKGRLSILIALSRKLNVAFAKELGETEQTANNGLGRLLKDADRIWTGAEIEVVIKEAFDQATYAGRIKKNGDRDEAIRVEDWNYAMDVILPNTGEVERMTDLSLLYVDNLGYCPQEWHARARDKDALRRELGVPNSGSDD